MDYLNKVKTNRTATQIQKDKQASMDMFISKLKDSGLLNVKVSTKELSTVLAQFVEKLDEIKPDNTDLLQAIKDLANKDTTVNYTPPDVVVPDIKAPNVVVPEIKIPEIKIPKIASPKVFVPDIDTSGIERAIREGMEREEPLQLENYKAHDIKTTGGKQYIGFVNPTGNWYIIENVIQENKLRYLFGSEDYSKVFENASTYEYKILSEAISEV